MLFWYGAGVRSASATLKLHMVGSNRELRAQLEKQVAAKTEYIYIIHDANVWTSINTTYSRMDIYFRTNRVCRQVRKSNLSWTTHKSAMWCVVGDEIRLVICLSLETLLIYISMVYTSWPIWRRRSTHYTCGVCRVLVDPVLDI